LIAGEEKEREEKEDCASSSLQVKCQVGERRGVSPPVPSAPYRRADAAPLANATSHLQ
jgi:hypothetical protein